MSKKAEIFEQIQEHFTAFTEKHNATTKAGATRARKQIGEVKKLDDELEGLFRVWIDKIIA